MECSTDPTCFLEKPNLSLSPTQTKPTRYSTRKVLVDKSPSFFYKDFVDDFLSRIGLSSGLRSPKLDGGLSHSGTDRNSGNDTDGDTHLETDLGTGSAYNPELTLISTLTLPLTLTPSPLNTPALLLLTVYLQRVVSHVQSQKPQLPALVLPQTGFERAT